MLRNENWTVSPAAAVMPPVADDAEADDAVRALRAYYDLGQAVAAADWKWATCHGKTKGFEPLLACEKGVLDEIQSLRARMPTASTKSTCGNELEDAHRLYVDGQERLHGDTVAWLEKRRAALTAAMRGRALSDACPAAGKACEDLAAWHVRAVRGNPRRQLRPRARHRMHDAAVPVRPCRQRVLRQQGGVALGTWAGGQAFRRSGR
ncbi:hypothetical protein WMF45_37045 [Sorangium sp. So ce448]|uniref:hypothetical protein n=1 Tax=Sorangium sp. So ce448 TaxID=3133314 RepID=UPI003F5D7B71